VKEFLKSVNIWQSYRQNAGCVILRIRLTRSSSKMKNSPEQWRQREFKVGRTSLVSRLSAFLTEANWWRLIAEWKRLEAERTEGNQYWSARPISESTQYFFWGGIFPLTSPNQNIGDVSPAGLTPVPQQESNLVHFSHKIWHGIIFSEESVVCIFFYLCTETIARERQPMLYYFLEYQVLVC